jgi:hypothetical protein
MIKDFLDKNFDDYDRKARLTPALLVGLPIVLTAASLFPEKFWSWGGVVGILVWCGLLRLIANIARDMGKATEHKLYDDWGGKPTTRMLRHSKAENKVLLARLHGKLFELTGQQLPSSDEEVADPDMADQTYDACVRSLVSKTRDQKKFSLLYKENCNYGFRRNLFGMKPLGITTALIGALFLIAQCVFSIGLPKAFSAWQNSGLLPSQGNLQFSNCPPLTLICLIVDLFLLVAWFLWIKSDWVRSAADVYAFRLLESSENLTQFD